MGGLSIEVIAYKPKDLADLWVGVLGLVTWGGGKEGRRGGVDGPL